MKNYSVTLLPIAQTDIKEIGDYIAYTLCNPDAAIKLIDEFNEQFDRIAKFPMSGKPLELDIPVEYNYFQAIIENYIIFYTVNENAERATVMRVLYAGSDYLVRLFSKPPEQ